MNLLIYHGNWFLLAGCSAEYDQDGFGFISGQVMWEDHLSAESFPSGKFLALWFTRTICGWMKSWVRCMKETPQEKKWFGSWSIELFQPPITKMLWCQYQFHYTSGLDSSAPVEEERNAKKELKFIIACIWNSIIKVSTLHLFITLLPDRAWHVSQTPLSDYRFFAQNLRMLLCILFITSSVKIYVPVHFMRSLCVGALLMRPTRYS